MARRSTIGNNSLDALIPAQPRSTDVAEDSEAGAVPSVAASVPVTDEVQSAEPPFAGSDGLSIPPGQYLSFYLSSEEYAVGILKIREIVEFEPLTRIPTAPDWIRGVMNLRGSVVPVVDLAVKVGLPPTQIARRTCVIIVEVEIADQDCVMGVIADAVSRVVDLGPGEIEEAPLFGTQVGADCLIGMGRVEDRFIPILDLDRVLSVDELFVTMNTTEVGVDAADQCAEAASTEVED